MTVVKDVNYLVEDLTFLFFKGKSLKEIQTKLIGLNSSRISSYYNDLSSYKGNQTKQKIARNLVDYEAGLTIFNTAKGIHKSNNSHQTTLEL